MKGAKKMICKSIARERTSHSRGAVNAVKVCSRWSLILLLLALAFAVPAWAQVCTPPPSGMVGWWPGDGNANDIVGSNNGTLHGGVTFTPGEVGQAFNFDGSTGYVQVPQNNLWEFGSNDFTVDFWINLRRLPTAGNLDQRDVFDIIGVDEGPGRRNKWLVRFGAGVLTFHVNDNGTGPGPVFLAQAPFSPNVGQWYFLAFTRNGNTWTTYINGVAAGTTTNYPRTINNINADLTWGLVEAGRFLNGLMDEVEIYNRGLSAVEIVSIFAAGSAGKCKPGSARAAYVANAGSNSVSVINPTTNTVVATVTVGHNPVHVAVTPNGANAYVSNAGANTVSVINTATNSVVATVQVGFNPVHAAVTPNGSSVYVTNVRSNSVSVISTATNAVLATVSVGANPVHVAITPDGGRAYVTNAGSNNVSVIDTATNTVTATVPVGRNPVNVAVF